MSTTGTQPSTPEVTETEGEDVGRDELFDVLSNERRRHALHYLKQHEGEKVDLSELSTQVTAWEEQVSPDEICYDDRKSVHTALTQFHVPKMCDAGVVDFQAQRNTVSLTDEGDDLTLYLETVEGSDIPWSAYFVLLSAFAGSVVVGVVAGVPGLGGFGATEAAVFVVALFLCSSLAFAYDSRYRMRMGDEGPPPG